MSCGERGGVKEEEEEEEMEEEDHVKLEWIRFKALSKNSTIIIRIFTHIQVNKFYTFVSILGWANI